MITLRTQFVRLPLLATTCVLVGHAALVAHLAVAQAPTMAPGLPGGQPFPQQAFPQQPQFNPNNYTPVGAPSEPTTSARPAGWPGAPPPNMSVATQWQRNPAQLNAPVPTNGVRPGPNGALPGAAPPRPGFAAPDGRGAALPPGQPWTEDSSAMKFELFDLDGARVIARVGTEVIQANEVTGYVNELMDANAAKIPPGQLEKVREKLTRDRLNHLIEIKLALVDARRKIPADNYPKVAESIENQFESKEVKDRMKRLNLNSRLELDQKMREHGSSLEHEKQAFVEQQMAMGWIWQQNKSKREVTHEDLLAYYVEHIDKYSFPAKARWEELRIRVANYRDRQAARWALGELGNAVVRGANFADVARARSQGPNASDGGQYDWTTQGSMASELLDRTIFELEVGKLSPILDDGKSPTISIVRVLERTEAGRQPFTEVQAEIKAKLEATHSEKDKEKVREYVAKLRAETPIWTIYDDEPMPGTAPAGGPAGPGGPTGTNTSLKPTRGPNDKAPAANPYLLR